MRFCIRAFSPSDVNEPGPDGTPGRDPQSALACPGRFGNVREVPGRGPTSPARRAMWPLASGRPPMSRSCRPLRVRRTAAHSSSRWSSCCLPGREAHEIPADVTVQAFVKPDGDRAPRASSGFPSDAMRDYDFPLRGPGYLGSRQEGPIRDAARQWIGDYVERSRRTVGLADPELRDRARLRSGDRVVRDVRDRARPRPAAPLPDDDRALSGNRPCSTCCFEVPDRRPRLRLLRSTRGGRTWASGR